MFELMVQIIAVSGIIGVALLMFAENVFPPIPSEVIMPLAGFAAARGEMDFILVVIAGTIGAASGAAVWYEVGRRLGAERLRRWSERHGRWLTLTPEDIDKATSFFRRFGAPAIFLGRLLPVVRTWISVPAGVADMKPWPFMVWTLLGTAIFTFILAASGYLLEAQYERVAAWLDPVTLGLMVLGGATYVWRLFTFSQPLQRRRRR
jgi:membrane protein DedA with SNARE-associated domain